MSSRLPELAGMTLAQLELAVAHAVVEFETPRQDPPVGHSYRNHHLGTVIALAATTVAEMRHPRSGALTSEQVAATVSADVGYPAPPAEMLAEMAQLVEGFELAGLSVVHAYRLRAQLLACQVLRERTEMVYGEVTAAIEAHLPAESDEAEDLGLAGTVALAIERARAEAERTAGARLRSILMTDHCGFSLLATLSALADELCPPVPPETT